MSECVPAPHSNPSSPVPFAGRPVQPVAERVENPAPLLTPESGLDPQLLPDHQLLYKLSSESQTLDGLDGEEGNEDKNNSVREVSPEKSHQISTEKGLGFLSFLSRSGGVQSSVSPGNCSGSSSGIFCRICHDGEGSEVLISPCQCTGSVALVHRSCIEKWLSTVNNDICELCHHKYLISRRSRPFVSWLCAPTVEEDQRNLVGDIICFVLLTPLAAISSYLCASGAAFYIKQEKKSESVGLICLCVALILIYILWFALTLRYHMQIWYSWRLANQDIRLVEVGRVPVSRNEWRNRYVDLQKVNPVERAKKNSDSSYVSLSQVYSANDKTPKPTTQAQKLSIILVDRNQQERIDESIDVLEKNIIVASPESIHRMERTDDSINILEKNITLDSSKPNVHLMVRTDDSIDVLEKNITLASPEPKKHRLDQSNIQIDVLEKNITLASPEPNVHRMRQSSNSLRHLDSQIPTGNPKRGNHGAPSDTEHQLSRYLSSFGEHLRADRDPRLSNTLTGKPPLKDAPELRLFTVPIASSNQLISQSNSCLHLPGSTPNFYVPHGSIKPLSPMVKNLNSTPSPWAKPYIRNDAVIYAEYQANSSVKNSAALDRRLSQVFDSSILDKSGEDVLDFERRSIDAAIDEGIHGVEDRVEEYAEEELLSLAQRRLILERVFNKGRREEKKAVGCISPEVFSTSTEDRQSSPWFGNQPIPLPGFKDNPVSHSAANKDDSARFIAH